MSSDETLGTAVSVSEEGLQQPSPQAENSSCLQTVEALSSLIGSGVGFSRNITRPNTPELEACASSVHHCARYGQIGLLEAMIAKGIDVNQEDSFGFTPLHFACSYGSLDSCKMLLSAGADPSAVCRKNGWTSLHLAARSASTLCIAAILDKVGEGVLQNRKDFSESSGPTTESKGSKQILNLVSLKDKGGNIALHDAAIGGNADCIRVLISAGSAVNETDNDGWTPLMFAFRFSKYEAADALLAANADLNCCDCDGWNALHNACRNGNMRSVSRLIAAGIDIHAQTKSGETALHLACRRDRSRMIRLLIEAGCHIDVKDGNGLSPWELCHSVDSKRSFVKAAQNVLHDGSASARGRMGKETASVIPKLGTRTMTLWRVNKVKSKIPSKNSPKDSTNTPAGSSKTNQNSSVTSNDNSAADPDKALAKTTSTLSGISEEQEVQEERINEGGSITALEKTPSENGASDSKPRPPTLKLAVRKVQAQKAQETAEASGIAKASDKFFATVQTQMASNQLKRALSKGSLPRVERQATLLWNVNTASTLKVQNHSKSLTCCMQ